MFVSPNRPDDHKRIIEFLVRESGASIDEVAALYEHKRAALEAGSRVKAFIPVIVIRHVRGLLRQRQSSQSDEILNAA